MSRRRINRSRGRKEQLRKEAAERLESWQAKSPVEQLKALDERLGEGVGATKQRTRLQEKIAEAAKAASNEAKVKKAKAKTKNKSKKTDKSEE